MIKRTHSILMAVCLMALIIFFHTNGNAVLIPGQIYAINWQWPKQELVRIEPDTGKDTVIAHLSDKFHWGLAISPDGTFWTITANGPEQNQQQYLAIINPATGSETIIGTLPARMIGLETDNEGNLYALGKDTGKIWLINKETGSGQVMGIAGPQGNTRGFSFNSQGVLSTFDGVRLYHFDFETGSYTAAGSTESYRYIWEGLAIREDDRIYILSSEQSLNPAALYEYDPSSKTTRQVGLIGASDIQGADFYYGMHSASHGNRLVQREGHK